MASSKAKVLTFYAITWLMVLVIGATGLMFLRRWGWSRIEEEHARTLFAQTRDMFDRGDAIQAQKTVVRLLKARPDRLAYALSVFDTDMIGMPAVLEAANTSPEFRELSDIEKLRQSIITGDTLSAEERFKAIPSGDKANREAALWKARALLMDGRFDEARAHFDDYWDGHADERDEVIAMLTPGKDGLKPHGASAADRLFRLGLWDEAAEAAENALAAGAEDPGLGFYAANRTEREGSKSAALAQYNRVLERLPNHALALRRVHYLSQAD